MSKLSRELPARIFLAGLVCFLGGYAALSYSPRTPQQADQDAKLVDLIRAMEESGLPDKATELRELSTRGGRTRPYAVAGRFFFWGGVVLMLVGGGAWLKQPPARRRPSRAEKKQERAERAKSYLPDDEDLELIECPFCHKSIYEESERCPQCGNYLSREDEEQPAERKPAWLALGVCVCLAMFLAWLLTR